MMIAPDDPFIRKFCSWDPRNNVVDRLDVPVGFYLQMHARRTRADVIGDRQSSAPGRRSNRATQRRKQRLSIPIGNRQNRNFCNRGSLRRLQSPGVGRGSDSGCKRIARIENHIHHAPALHALLRTPRAAGENISFEIAVLARIRVNDAADRTVFRGHFGFNAAPGSRRRCKDHGPLTEMPRCSSVS